MRYEVDKRWEVGPRSGETGVGYLESISQVIFIESEPGMLKDPCDHHYDGCSCNQPLEWHPFAVNSPEYWLSKEINNLRALIAGNGVPEGLQDQHGDEGATHE